MLRHGCTRRYLVWNCHLRLYTNSIFKSYKSKLHGLQYGRDQIGMDIVKDSITMRKNKCNEIFEVMEIYGSAYAKILQLVDSRGVNQNKRHCFNIKVLGKPKWSIRKFPPPPPTF